MQGEEGEKCLARYTILVSITSVGAQQRRRLTVNDGLCVDVAWVPFPVPEPYSLAMAMLAFIGLVNAPAREAAVRGLSMTQNNSFVSSLWSAGRVLTCVLAVVQFGALSGEAALVSHWMGENNANDSVGSNHGTEVGDTGYAAGLFGQAFSLDGDGDKVDIPDDPSLDVGTTFTKHVWFNPDVVTGGSKGIFLQGYDDAEGKNNYLLVNSSLLKYGVRVHGTIGGTTVLSANGTDPWYHGVVTYDGTDLNMYLDGGTEMTDTPTIDMNGDSRVIFGNYERETFTGGCCWFDGLIDDPALWDEALTAGEVKGLYDVGNDSTLRYDAGQFDSLKQVHDAGSGSAAIGALTWTYATGLGSTEGLSGSGGNFRLVFDGSLGTGVRTGQGPLPPTNSNWINEGTGAWHTGSNWTSGVPNDSNQTAIFGSMISSPATVTVDAPVTVRGITFDNSNTYAIAGTSNVNLDAGTAGDAAVAVRGGDHQFQLPVTLNNDTVVDVATGSSLSFNHELNLGGNTLTKTGSGTLFINSQLTQPGGMVVINGGVLGGSGTIGGDVINDGILAPGKNSGIGADSSVVPEPIGLALIGSGLLALMAMAGRRGN